MGHVGFTSSVVVVSGGRSVVFVLIKDGPNLLHVNCLDVGVSLDGRPYGKPLF